MTVPRPLAELPESDALATVRFAVTDAIASTYGMPAEALIDALVSCVSDPSVAWAFAELSGAPSQ